MNGLTNYITEWNWNDIITSWYVLVDEMYPVIIESLSEPLRRRGPAPRMSDSEVITVSLIIEAFFQDHEEVRYVFVTQYLSEMFPDLLNLDHFNARRIAMMEQIRRLLHDQKLDSTNPFRIADSAPITLLTYTRGKCSQSAIGSDYFGVITSKNAKFFGLRFHATLIDEQLIDEWMVAPASVHDKTALDTLLLESRDLVVWG